MVILSEKGCIKEWYTHLKVKIHVCNFVGLLKTRLRAIIENDFLKIIALSTLIFSATDDLFYKFLASEFQLQLHR